MDGCKTLRRSAESPEYSKARESVQTNSFFTTFPDTSVNRKSRPM